MTVQILQKVKLLTTGLGRFMQSLPVVEKVMPIVVLEVSPRFLPMPRRYRVLKWLFRFSAVEGEDHEFELRVKNRSYIPFDGGDLEIVSLVIPSIVSGSVVALKHLYKIPHLAARDQMVLGLGPLTFRGAGNAEMTARLSSDTQVAALWYQKQWSGDALINVSVWTKSNVIWLGITAINLLVAAANAVFTVMTRH